jgi:hypothetical protein
MLDDFDAIPRPRSRSRSVRGRIARDDDNRAVKPSKLAEFLLGLLLDLASDPTSSTLPFRPDANDVLFSQRMPKPTLGFEGRDSDSACAEVAFRDGEYIAARWRRGGR